MKQLLLEDKIAKMVSILSIPDEFGGYEEDGDDNLDYKVWDRIHRNGGSIANGASKMVIIIDNCDKVIKIPYRGSFRYSEYYNEETERWETEDDPCFFEFECAGGSHNPWDYCEVEEEVYDMAVEYGVEQFFAKTRCYSYVDMHPVYIQERVKEFYDSEFIEREPSKKADEIYKSNRDLQHKFDSLWVKYAIDWYGEEAVTNLINFLDEYGLGDFHNHNVGFRLNGAPVILDYSDFND